METFSALVSLCVGTPPVTGGVPTQRDTNADLLCSFCCQPEQTIEHTLDCPMNRDPMVAIWRRRDVRLVQRVLQILEQKQKLPERWN